MSLFELLYAAKEKYPQGTKTLQGRIIGEIRLNKNCTKIVCDTVNIYDIKTETWIEKL
jgi:hypothetical protein